MQQSLEKMEDYLRLLRPHPETELLKEFDEQDFHLNLNFFSEKQYKLFLEEFTSFMQSFIPKMIEEEQRNPDDEKVYLFSMNLLPIRKILDRIMDARKEEL